MPRRLRSARRLGRPPSRSSLLPFSLNYFFMAAASAVISPHLQLFVEARGFDPSRLGFLLGCYALAGVLGPLVLARLADGSRRYRPLLVVAAVGSAAAFVPLSFLSGVRFYLPLLVLMGFAGKASMPLTDSLATIALQDPIRQYGRVRIVSSVGFITASLLLQVFPFVEASSAMPILVSYLVATAAYAAVIPLLPDVPPEDAAGREAENRRPSGSAGGPQDSGRPPGSAGSGGLDGAFWLLMAIVFLGRFGMSSHYSFFSLYLQNELGLDRVSGIWAVGSFAEIPVILFSGAIIRRFGIVRMLYASLAGIAVRLALYAAFPNVWVAVSAQLLHALTLGTFHTASVAFIYWRVRAAQRAQAMAVYMSVGIGLATLVGSSLGGAILQSAGFRQLYLLFASAPLLGVFVLALTGRMAAYRTG